MTAQQPEARALYLARELEAGSFMPNILQNENGLRINSAAELRRLHARVQELEAQQERKPLTGSQIASVCLSYRHDFGLLSKEERVFLFTYSFHKIRPAIRGHWLSARSLPPDSVGASAAQSAH